jgi:hypothetical protein
LQHNSSRLGDNRKLVVVFVNQHLHIAVKTLNLRRHLGVLAHEPVETSAFQERPDETVGFKGR